MEFHWLSEAPIICTISFDWSILVTRHLCSSLALVGYRRLWTWKSLISRVRCQPKGQSAAAVLKATCYPCVQAYCSYNRGKATWLDHVALPATRQCLLESSTCGLLRDFVGEFPQFYNQLVVCCWCWLYPVKSVKPQESLFPNDVRHEHKLKCLTECLFFSIDLCMLDPGLFPWLHFKSGPKPHLCFFASAVPTNWFYWHEWGSCMLFCCVCCLCSANVGLRMKEWRKRILHQWDSLVFYKWLQPPVCKITSKFHKSEPNQGK